MTTHHQHPCFANSYAGQAMKLILPLLLLFATICNGQIVSTNGNLLVTDATNTSGWYQGNGGGLTNLVNADTNGAGTAAAAGLSNLLGSAAYVSTNSFDTNGAAVAVTNGYPWGGLYDTNNAGIAAALAATNGSWLSASNLVVTATNGSWISASNLVFNATNNYVGGVTLGGVSNVVAAYTNVLASTNYVNTATNNFGNSVAVTMTNSANQFTGNGAGLKGVNATNISIIYGNMLHTKAGTETYTTTYPTFTMVHNYASKDSTNITSDTSGGLFTAPIAGYYELSGGLNLLTQDQQDAFCIGAALSYTGSTMLTGEYYAYTQPDYTTFLGIIYPPTEFYLTAGQQIGLGVCGSTGEPFQIEGGSFKIEFKHL
jgi:hypothetical protein